MQKETAALLQMTAMGVFDILDIRKITYFCEVVCTKNFSKAAQKLYVSQPMLSKSIRQLDRKSVV